MNTYRVTFSINGLIDYWGNKKLQSESFFAFRDLPLLYYPIIKDIKKYARQIGIKYIWHFYEPYVEITWLSDEKLSENLISKVRLILIKNEINLKNLQIFYPKNNDENFGDWFCKNESEKEFGCKVHSLCSDYVDLYNEYKDSIDNGKTLKEQVKRTIHRLCNPLGLNYLDEAYICFSRGLICLLFRFFSFKKAVWIYTKIFRQKY